MRIAVGGALILLTASAAVLVAVSKLAQDSQRLSAEMVLLQRGRPLSARIRPPDEAIAVASDDSAMRRMSWVDTFAGIVYVATVDGDGIVQGLDRRHIEYALGWREARRAAGLLAALSIAVLLWAFIRRRMNRLRVSS